MFSEHLLQKRGDLRTYYEEVLKDVTIQIQMR